MHKEKGLQPVYMSKRPVQIVCRGGGKVVQAVRALARRLEEIESETRTRALDGGKLDAEFFGSPMHFVRHRSVPAASPH